MKSGKKAVALALAGVLAVFSAACGSGGGQPQMPQSGRPGAGQSAQADLSVLGTDLPVVEYSGRDLSGEYDSSVTEIALGTGDVVITQPGTYILSGTLADGQVRVEAGDTDKVQLVLSGVNITNSNGPAIYVRTADKVFLTLAEGTVNTLTDGTAYNMAGDENEPDGCVFSQEDLTINGSGALTVTGNYSHGVITKDDLTITGGSITVTAVNEGLKGKDAVQICGGILSVDAGDDAVSSSNDTDGEKGWVSIDGGDLTLSAGDDGIHAEGALVINGGVIRVLQSTEGLEGRSVTITGGDITVESSDDGVNAAGGVGGSSGDSMRSTAVNYINITGGSLWVTALGDGLDSNGPLSVSGGTVFVSQSGGGNSALDADGGSVITGGTVAAAGASQMAQTFGETSTQYSFLYCFDSTISAGTPFTVTSADGTELLTFAPERDYQCVAVSTPELAGETYTVTAGTSSGEITLTGISTSNGSGMAGGMGGPGRGGGAWDGGQRPEDGTRPSGGTKPPKEG